MSKTGHRLVVEDASHGSRKEQGEPGREAFEPLIGEKVVIYFSSTKLFWF